MLRILGAILYNFQRLKVVAIGKYLTSKVQADGGRLTGRVTVQNPEHIYIGSGSYVNGGDLVAGKKSCIRIGKNVMISYGVHIRTTMHNYESRDIPMIQQGENERDIIIEDNCWIGHSVHIMSGVTIHSGSVVGANAVVTKDVPPNVVVAGVPAKIIKYLTEES